MAKNRESKWKNDQKLIKNLKKKKKIYKIGKCQKMF